MVDAVEAGSVDGTTAEERASDVGEAIHGGEQVPAGDRTPLS
jgi:hypothetical protein